MSSRRARKSPQLNYNHLHYFHVAAVEGSVGGAAQCLGVTQPTISEQLRTLERTLGVVLFERQSSGLKLTEAGRLTFKHTSIMFGAGARLAEELDHGSQQVPHLLRIGICGQVARLLTPSLMTPLLEIERCLPSIRIADHVELLRELRTGGLDMALTDTEPPKSERRGIETVQLQRTPLSVVAPPSIRPSADWHELQLLHYRVGSQLRWDVDAFLASRGLRPRIAAESDDIWLLLDAVGRDHHIAIVPTALVRDSLAAGRLKELERFESAHLTTHALYRSGIELARTAVERLVGHLGSQAE